jgi:hypothetical protein
MSGTVSFDLDGVLANFTRGFTRVGRRLFGTPVGNESNQKTWDFEAFPELRLDKTLTKQMWADLLRDNAFWTNLDPLNVSVMPEVDAIRNKVFITNRAGIDPKTQSERFLEAWGVREPRVFLASEKVPVAKELQVVAHVDDYIVNCRDLKAALPDAYIAMLWTPYNEVHHAEWRALGGEIVVSVEQFIDEADRRKLIVR